MGVCKERLFSVMLKSLLLFFTERGGKFHCHVCGAEYSRADALKRHQKKCEEGDYDDRDVNE